MTAKRPDVDHLHRELEIREAGMDEGDGPRRRGGGGRM